MLLLVAVAVAPLAAQTDEARIAEEIAVMEATLARLHPELAALEQAVRDPNVHAWMTIEGNTMATAEELTQKVAFLQMAAARPEARDRTEAIAGMELPAALAEAARQKTNRPAQRLVRDWIESEGAKNEKEVAYHHQSLKRTIKMTESWLAEHRSAQQASRQAPSQNVAYAQGPCHVPPGRYQVGSTREVLEVTADAYFVTATKTRGSRNVPAGKINFYVHPRTCDAGLQTAEEGFVNPYWIRSRIQVNWIEPGTSFSIEWPERAPVTYTKVD